MSEVQGKVAKIEAMQETSSQQVEANSRKLEEQAKEIRELRASLRRQEEANKQTKVGLILFFTFLFTWKNKQIKHNHIKNIKYNLKLTN